MSSKFENIKMLQLDILAANIYEDGKKERQLLSTAIQTTTFQLKSSEAHGCLFKEGVNSVYQRFRNPILYSATEKIDLLKGAETAEVFPSRIAAIMTALLILLQSGNHFVTEREIFARLFYCWINFGTI